MNKRQVKTVNNLLLFASFALVIGITLFVPKEQPEPTPEPTETEASEEKGRKGKKKEIVPFISKETELRNIWSSIPIEYVTLQYDYIGRHYITAYCPEECGYRVYEDGTDNFPKGWITATGTTCHREEDWWNPSTCGIATDYHRYGEMFLIDGKIYVAEDTGLISGAWIDLFMPSYEEMSNFGSHYTEVYSVSYVKNYLSAKERMNLHESINYYLHFGSVGGRCPFRNNH